MRVERKHDDPLATLLQQTISYAFDGWLAIAHRPVHDHIWMVGKCLGKLLALRARIGPQRRFVFLAIPDAVVKLAGTFRAGVENDAVEDRIPDQAGPFDDTAIRKKLGQIAPHRAVTRAIRRAEIDQQNPDFRQVYLHLRLGCLAGLLLHFIHLTHLPTPVQPEN